MPVSSVLCHLCRHLVSGHIVSHQVSPSQLWSPTIPLSVYRHLQDLSRGIIFISPLNMSKPSQPLLSEELRHRVHACLFPDVYVTWSTLVFPLAHRSMRISVTFNCLSSFFLTAQHSAPYTMAGFIAVLYTLLVCSCRTSPQ